MTESSLEAIWQTFENCLALVEIGQGNQQQLCLAIQNCVQLILEHSPAEVVARADNSPLPTRSIVSWLVFEAAKLGGASGGQAAALKEYWEENQPGRQGIIEAVPAHLVD